MRVFFFFHFIRSNKLIWFKTFTENNVWELLNSLEEHTHTLNYNEYVQAQKIIRFSFNDLFTLL